MTLERETLPLSLSGDFRLVFRRRLRHGPPCSGEVSEKRRRHGEGLDLPFFFFKMVFYEKLPKYVDLGLKVRVSNPFFSRWFSKLFCVFFCLLSVCDCCLQFSARGFLGGLRDFFGGSREVR